jgi:hypothetical protein
MGGELTLLLVPIVIVWLIYSAFVVWRRPTDRRLQIAKACACLAALGIITTAQWYHYYSARTAANQILAKLEAFKHRHGKYLGSLGEVHVAEGPLTFPQGLSYELDPTGNPSLVYMSTFAIFDIYDYDFGKHEWTYIAD